MFENCIMFILHSLGVLDLDIFTLGVLPCHVSVITKAMLAGALVPSRFNLVLLDD